MFSPKSMSNLGRLTVLFPPDSSLRSTEVYFIFLSISQYSLCPFNNVPTDNIKSHNVYNTVAFNLLFGWISQVESLTNQFAVYMKLLN